MNEALKSLKPGPLGMSTYYSVESTSFVALRTALLVLAFPSAKLAEIFSSSRRHICKKFQFQTAQRLTC